MYYIFISGSSDTSTGDQTTSMSDYSYDQFADPGLVEPGLPGDEVQNKWQSC